MSETAVRKCGHKRKDVGAIFILGEWTEMPGDFFGINI